MKMKWKVTAFGVAVMMILASLCGCDDYHEPSFAKLPEHYIEFEPYGWQSPDVEEDNSMAFDYNGRTYLYYGDTTFYHDETVFSANTVGAVGNIGSNWVFGLGVQPYDVRECLGCIVRHMDWMEEGEVDDSDHVLSLTYSDANDYLIVYPTGIGADFMSPMPSVYRAMDTRGKDIETPSYIQPQTPGNPMYAYWNVENDESAA